MKNRILLSLALLLLVGFAFLAPGRMFASAAFGAGGGLLGALLGTWERKRSVRAAAAGTQGPTSRPGWVRRVLLSALRILLLLVLVLGGLVLSIRYLPPEVFEWTSSQPGLRFAALGFVVSWAAARRGEARDEAVPASAADTAEMARA